MLKLANYNTIYLKQKANLETVAVDREAADILKDTVS